MRNMVRILTVGALVGWLSGGLAYADGAAVATFKVIALQKVVAPGETFTVEVRLENVTDLGAYQFMMKLSNGTVKDIALSKTQQDYVFGSANSIGAFDAKQNRAGAVLMNGGKDVVSGSVATVTLQAPKKLGTFHVNVAEGQETFLRDSSAVPIPVVIGKDWTITVSDRATPSSRDKKRSSR
ncbi:MAG: hypothetical protein IIB57_05945 [Planctomycetes bacterium]|nr:hypothetical protein [Planctomycetota bacterium]